MTFHSLLSFCLDLHTVYENPRRREILVSQFHNSAYLHFTSRLIELFADPNLLVA